MDKSKHFIKLCLRMFKDGLHTEEEVTQHLIDWQRSNNVFNWHSFFKGATIGWIVTSVVKDIIQYYIH